MSFSRKRHAFLQSAIIAVSALSCALASANSDICSVELHPDTQRKDGVLKNPVYFKVRQTQGGKRFYVERCSLNEPKCTRIGNSKDYDLQKIAKYGVASNYTLAAYTALMITSARLGVILGKPFAQVAYRHFLTREAVALKERFGAGLSGVFFLMWEMADDSDIGMKPALRQGKELPEKLTDGIDLLRAENLLNRATQDNSKRCSVFYDGDMNQLDKMFEFVFGYLDRRSLLDDEDLNTILQKKAVEQTQELKVQLKSVLEQANVSSAELHPVMKRGKSSYLYTEDAGVQGPRSPDERRVWVLLTQSSRGDHFIGIDEEISALKMEPNILPGDLVFVKAHVNGENVVFDRVIPKDPEAKKTESGSETATAAGGAAAGMVMTQAERDKIKASLKKWSQKSVELAKKAANSPAALKVRKWGKKPYEISKAAGKSTVYGMAPFMVAECIAKQLESITHSTDTVAQRLKRAQQLLTDISDLSEKEQIEALKRSELTNTCLDPKTYAEFLGLDDSDAVATGAEPQVSESSQKDLNLEPSSNLASAPSTVAESKK